MIYEVNDIVEADGSGYAGRAKVTAVKYDNTNGSPWYYVWFFERQSDGVGEWHFTGDRLRPVLEDAR